MSIESNCYITLVRGVDILKYHGLAPDVHRIQLLYSVVDILRYHRIATDVYKIQLLNNVARRGRPFEICAPPNPPA